MRLYLTIKRFIDVGLSLLIISLIIPFALIIAGVLKISYWQHSILFIQKRMGKNGVIFKMYKFRTIHSNCPKEEIGHSIQDVSRIGRFLRAYSLDEIPQLINVLKGEMSIIGPRPLPISYQEIIHQECPDRHVIRPGLFCLSHLYGRNKLSWKARLGFDHYYVHQMGLKTDLYLLLFLPVVILRGDGNIISPILTDTSC